MPRNKPGCRKHGNQDMRIWSGHRACAVCNREKSKTLYERQLGKRSRGWTEAQKWAYERRRWPDHQHTTVFVCGHDNIYPDPQPKAGDSLYCRTCCDWRQIVEVISEKRISA